MHFSLYPLLTGLLSSWLMVGFSHPAEATSRTPKLSPVPTNWQAQRPQSPRGPVGQPTGENRGAASRGDDLKCGKGNFLTALTSKYPEYTVSDRPTLWFSISCSLTDSNFVRFSLRENTDEVGSGQVKWQVIIPPGTTPGVIQVQIPREQALQVGKDYEWVLTIFGKDPDTERDPDQAGVKGVIRRIAPSAQLTEQLRKSQSNPRAQMLAYESDNIWFDALHALAGLRQNRPNDPTLRQDWQRLLKRVGVEDVWTMPLRPCCSRLQKL